MSGLRGVGHRLYVGETSFDFIGRRRIWYGVALGIIVVAALALGLRGLNFGIEFRGGAEFRVPGATCSVEQARSTVSGVTPTEAIVQEIGSGGDLRVQTAPLAENQPSQVRDALARACGVQPDAVSVQIIGPSWGGEVTQKAVTGLVVFLLLVVALIWVAFNRSMAIAAIIALLHDIVITVGVYALVGFDVTPATLIGLLTILGYSLYDTVVVFDSIRENTRGLLTQSTRTYAETANLSVNQTLVRSINTSLIALLPVASILFFGVFALGAGTLKDLALILFVGIAASTYSSIFIATPLLVDLRQRDPQIQALQRRVMARRSGVRGEAVTSGARRRAPRPRGATAAGGATAADRIAAADPYADIDTARELDDRGSPILRGPHVGDSDLRVDDGVDEGVDTGDADLGDVPDVEEPGPGPARRMRPAADRSQPQRRPRSQRRSGPKR